MYRNPMSSISTEILRQIDQWRSISSTLTAQLDSAGEAARQLQDARQRTEEVVAAYERTVGSPWGNVSPIFDAVGNSPLLLESARIAEQQAALMNRLDEVHQASLVVGQTLLEPFQAVTEAYRHIDWLALDRFFSPGLEVQQSALELGNAYIDLMAPISGNVLIEDPSLAIVAGWETHRHSAFLWSLSEPDGLDTASVYDEEERSNDLDGAGQELESLLGNQYPELLPLRRASRDLLASSRSRDEIRQYCILQEEILGQLLLLAAPDQAVRKWTSEEKHFLRNGSPTREARLSFLSAKADKAAYGSFLQVDVNAAISVFRALREGVYRVEIEDGPLWVTNLQLRADHLLLAILVLSSQG